MPWQGPRRWGPCSRRMGAQRLHGCMQSGYGHTWSGCHRAVAPRAVPACTRSHPDAPSPVQEPRVLPLGHLWGVSHLLLARTQLVPRDPQPRPQSPVQGWPPRAMGLVSLPSLPRLPFLTRRGTEVRVPQTWTVSLQRCDPEAHGTETRSKGAAAPGPADHGLTTAPPLPPRRSQ